MDHPSDLRELEGRLHFRFQEQSCANCRFYRTHTTTATSSECLLLGRTLSLGELPFILPHDRARVCDGWKQRPRAWLIHSDGHDTNPHWYDPYLPRAENQRRRARLLATLKKKGN